MRPPDKGGWWERVRTGHICGVLPQGNPVGKLPSTGLPCGVVQCGEAMGTFHVPEFSV